MPEKKGFFARFGGSGESAGSVPPPVSKDSVINPEDPIYAEEKVLQDEERILEDRTRDLSKEQEMMIAKLERMKTQIETLNEVRNVNNERFERISEQLGEQRSMIIEKEKQILDLNVAATRAIDLVKAVQPEKLMSELRRMDMKLEKFNAEIDRKDVTINTLKEELKRVKNKFAEFRGMDQIIELNKQIKDDMVAMQHIKVLTERHADKTEQIFVNVQKDFAEFQKFHSVAKKLEENAHVIQKDFDKLKIQFSNAANKKEFDSFKEEIKTLINEVKTTTIDLKKDSESVRKFTTEKSDLLNTMNNLKSLNDQVLDKNQKMVQDYNEKMQHLLTIIDIFKKRIDELNSKVYYISGNVGSQNSFLSLNQDSYAQLRNFIVSCIERNMDYESIKRQLLNMNYTEQMIDSVFLDISLNPNSIQ